MITEAYTSMLEPTELPPEPVTEAIPQLRVESEDGSYARIIVEPLNPGYGITLGNSLRRILLGSLEGAAITSARIDQVQHEFSPLVGLQEDTTEFLLNVKEIRIRALSNRPGTLTLDAEGPGDILARDLQVPADFEIVNPDHVLGHMDSDKARINAEFHVELGVGYVSATALNEMPLGVIPVDAVFAPIRKCNFFVEKTRVGQSTDYDRLLLEVWTDDTIDPVDAVGQAADILMDQFAIFSQMGRPVIPAPIAGGPAPAESALGLAPDRYNTPIEDLNLSVRAYNCLKRSGLMTVGQVLERNEDELLSLRNFGRKSYDELRDRLIELEYVDGNAEGLKPLLDDPAAATTSTATAPAARAVILDEEDEDESLGALGKALKEALREVGDDDLLGADDEA